MNEYELEALYVDALNEQGTVLVCGIEFEPATILKELDPMAYRCGLLDFIDSIEQD